MSVKSFSISVRGASHIKKNRERQDEATHLDGDGYALAVVCDGHGGDDYVRSAVGAKIGCYVARKNLDQFIADTDRAAFLREPDKHLRHLKESIINGWNEGVAAYQRKKAFTEEELEQLSPKARKKYVDDGKIESAYGTTLIAIAMTRDFWFGLQVGDGKCIAVSRAGEFSQAIKLDDKCFLNETTSICDSDAINHFHHVYAEELPAAVFIGTDGIDDCFSNDEQLHGLYKTVLYSFATTGFDEAYKGLEDYLPRLSSKGSGDDVSIAAVLDADCIRDMPLVKKFEEGQGKAKEQETTAQESEKPAAEQEPTDKYTQLLKRDYNQQPSNRLSNLRNRLLGRSWSRSHYLPTQPPTAPVSRQQGEIVFIKVFPYVVKITEVFDCEKNNQ